MYIALYPSLSTTRKGGGTGCIILLFSPGLGACINFYGQMSSLWDNSAFSWGRHRRGVTKVEMFCLPEY